VKNSPYDSYELVEAYRARNSGARRLFFNQVEMSILTGIDLRGTRVLDIGTGVGQKAVAVAPFCRMVVGADLSFAMLRGAKLECAQTPHIALMRCDATRLPFPSGVFGLILCYGLLEGTGDFAPFLSEFARVSQPGAHLVLTCPNGGAFRKAKWSKLRKMHKSLHDVQSMLTEAGYTLKRHHTIFYLSGYLLWGPAILLSLVGLDRAFARFAVAVEDCLSRSAITRGRGKTHLLLAQLDRIGSDSLIID
jgi:ubiquinone/menaquinone biosynthesis C-methylase UbiE